MIRYDTVWWFLWSILRVHTFFLVPVTRFYSRLFRSLSIFFLVAYSFSILSRFLSHSITLPLSLSRSISRYYKFSFRFGLSISLSKTPFTFFSFAHSSLVRTGGEALYGFVLMGIQLPRRISVDLTVHG